jgi:hypothetical protein
MDDKDEIIESADNLASNVKSFLASLPYVAPEMIEFQANVKLAEPLAEYQIVRGK